MPNNPYHFPELDDPELLTRLAHSHRVINNFSIDALNGDIGIHDALSLIHAEADYTVGLIKRNRTFE